MGSRRLNGFSVLVAVGAVVALGAATEGCIYHEADDILFPDPGHKWCTTLVDAAAWDNDPDEAEDIADGGQWPSACVCFNESDNTLLEGWENDPPMSGEPGYSEFIQLTDTIRNAAVSNCIEMREDLWPNLPNDNCATIAQTSTIFQSDASGESDCTLFNTVDGDTDGYDTDASSSITCQSSRSCDIDQAFWNEIANDPMGLHRDKTHGIFSSRGTTLRDVYPGSIAYQLKLRTGDLITAVNGMPVTNLEDVEAAIDALQGLTSWTVTVKRGQRTLTFVYSIV